MTFKLFPEQEKCLEDMLEHPLGGILHGEMGTGKTGISLEIISRFICKRDCHKPKAKHFIICPKSAIITWKNELKTHFGSLKYYHFENKKHDILDEKEFKNCDIVISTYIGVQKIVPEEKLNEIQYLFIDESHNLSNPKSNKYQTLFNFIKKTCPKCVWCLTGTPIQNNDEELQTQCKLVFYNSSSTLGLQSTEKIIYDHVVTLKRNYKIEENPHIRKLEMSCIEKKIYKDLENKQTNSTKKSIELISSLRQCCISPDLLNAKVNNFENNEESTKIKEILKDMRKVPVEDKIIVFSFFKASLNLLRKKCLNDGDTTNLTQASPKKILSTKLSSRPNFYIIGDRSIKQRETILRDFMTSKGGILFITFKTGSESLNLICANHIFFMDNWWNPTTITQAIARSSRFGQKKEVNWYSYIMLGTIEERIEKILTNKKEKIEQLYASRSKGEKKTLLEDDSSSSVDTTSVVGIVKMKSMDQIVFLLGKEMNNILSTINDTIKRFSVYERKYEDMMS